MQEMNAFVTYLEDLKTDRGKLAALRRGLGMAPGTCVAMYPIVAARLPYGISRQEEERHYMIAALFGAHPSSCNKGNIGNHMRSASGEKVTPAVERRFTHLLGSRWEDLSDQLRHTVSFLNSKEVAINYQQLFYDLKYWEHPDRFVQRQWANAFWGYAADIEEQEKEN
jgi:CRISPR system Cascade subunit CasB